MDMPEPDMGTRGGLRADVSRWGGDRREGSRVLFISESVIQSLGRELSHIRRKQIGHNRLILTTVNWLV